MLNLDTHIVIDALKGNLSRWEEQLLRENEWSLSTIVLWEIAKLSEFRKIDFSFDDAELVRDLSRFHVWPIDISVCRALKQLDFKSDPADELIAATSIVHNIPLLTRDKRILKSKITPLAR